MESRLAQYKNKVLAQDIISGSLLHDHCASLVYIALL